MDQSILSRMLLVNSRHDAMNFWLTVFGEPDYLSTLEDADEIESLLSDLREEFDSLEREIKRTNTSNQFKLNKVTSLYFVINEGEHYLAALRIVIENRSVLAEKEFADEYGHPYEREFDDEDQWRENSLFNEGRNYADYYRGYDIDRRYDDGDEEDEDDDYETPNDWNLR